MKKYFLIVAVASAVLALSVLSYAGPGGASFGGSDYLSPGTIALDKKRNTAYTVLTTAGSVAVTDLKRNETTDIIRLRQNPNDIAVSPDGRTLYVSCGGRNGTVEVIGLPGENIKASIKVGHTPEGMALAPDGRTLYVANRFDGNVSVIDLAQNRQVAVIPAVREPRTLCMTPDGKTLAVANFLPAQASNGNLVAAEVTLVDTKTREVRANVILNNGAQSVWGLACSAGGKFFYAVHLISQYNTLITQLDRGWVNTNALSIIDAEDGSVYAAVLLDDVDRGAANPAGICIDGDKLHIALAGAHELMTVDLGGLHGKLEALFAGRLNDLNVKSKAGLTTSMSFAAPFRERVRLHGRSPRSVVIAEGTPLVSSRFGTFLEKLFPAGEREAVLISLGKEPASDAARRGELAFYDAGICYQNWQSCASCHPEGRADGMNWDQENDGFGNPKNSKSLLFSHATPPSMITGIRKSAEMAVRNGILHTLLTRQPDELACDMDEYLKALRPAESPRMTEYLKRDPQQKGKEIFERAGCARCHSGEYHTDLQKYNVGTGDGDDSDTEFDTPTLREAWRTAPYLYDGRAVSLMEVLTIYNKDDRHGATRGLSQEELDLLELYIATL